MMESVLGRKRAEDIDLFENSEEEGSWKNGEDESDNEPINENHYNAVD